MTLAPGAEEGPIAPSATVAPPDAGDAEDNGWIHDFQAGREQGFNRLVLKYKDRAYGLCQRMLRSQALEAEDAAQESFVRAYRGLKDFRFEAKFSSWMYCIAVNVCKNNLASRAWQEARSHRDLQSADAEGGRVGYRGYRE